MGGGGGRGNHHFVLEAVVKWKLCKMWSGDLKDQVD